MEFPRRCSTGVYNIDGFSTVHHCTYTILPKLSDPVNVGPLLWNALASLRENGYLAASDSKRSALWIFAGPNAVPDSVSEDISGLRAAKDIINKQRQTFEYNGGGSFQAARLPEIMGRSTTGQRASTRASNTTNSSHAAIYIDAHLSTHGMLLISSVYEVYDTILSVAAPKQAPLMSVHNGRSINAISSPSWPRSGGFGTIWRTAVQLWLRSKGITIPNINTVGAWKSIANTDVDKPNLASGALLPPVLPSTFSCEWPTSLVRDDYSLFREKVKDSSQPRDTNDTDSSHVSDDFDLLDAFTFAQKWTIGSDERGKAIEALRLAKRAEKENSSIQPSSGSYDTSFPSSPIYARAGDPPAVNAIYPTPPDGFTSQAPNISSVLATSHQLELRTEDHAEQEFPSISSNPQSDELSPEYTESAAQPAGFRDELFDEIGEDGFGAAGVTDADFSFFDEPGGQNMDMDFEKTLLNSDVKDESLEKQDSQNEQHHVVVKTESAQGGIADDGPVLDIFPVEDITPDKSDVQRRNSDAIDCTIGLEAKRNAGFLPLAVSSPRLTPVVVLKALFQGSDKADRTLNRQLQTSEESQKAFNPVSFGTKIVSFDQKYGNSGRFNFDVGTSALDSSQKVNTNPAAISGLREQKPLDLREPHGVSGSISLTSAAGNHQPEDSTDEGYSSDTDVDTTSNDEEIAYHRNDLSISEEQPDNRSNKRKRNGSETSSSPQNLEKNHNSEQRSFGTSESQATTKQEACHLIQQIDTNLYGSASRWVPANLKTSSPRYLHNDDGDEFRTSVLHEKDAINIVQILSDEHVYANSRADIRKVSTIDARTSDPAGIENLEYSLQAALKRVFPTAEDCDLVTLASIQETTADSQATKTGQRPTLPRKHTEGTGSGRDSIFRIAPPHVKVQRSDKVLHVLPPAGHFWDTLGLGPLNGPKDLLGYCVYPSNLRTQTALIQFFDCLASTYENRRLGSHEMDRNDLDYDRCFFPYKVDSSTPLLDILQIIQSTCTEAGKSIASKRVDGKIIVVYLINPFRERAVFGKLCQAIWLLLQAYNAPASSLRAVDPKPEIILKIIDIDSIPREDDILDPNPEDLLRLAHEMYERCPASNLDHIKSGLSIRCGSATQLAAAIPKSVQFKMTADPPSDLLDDNSFFHLAYSWSASGQWLTTAWIDSFGQHQATASYSLYGRKFNEVAREIWETTLNILKSKNVNWRVVIAKEGLLTPSETDSWAKLFTASGPLQLTTTLVSVDAKPCLTITVNRLLGSGNTETLGKAHAHTPSNAANLATPVSTPTPSADPATPAPSPTAGAESLLESSPDSRLIDHADETWGVVLGTRMRTSAVLGDWCPSLMSGLLVKRGISGQLPNLNHTTRMPCIAVHIDWIGSSAAPTATPGISSSSSTPLLGPTRNCEMLMKEILSMYRGLGTLAKARFMDDGMGGVLPWHLIAARRGATALDECLPV